MRIGDLTGNVEQSILDLGFPFTDEITILGFVLKNNGDIVDRNYQKITENILKIMTFDETVEYVLPCMQIYSSE